MAGSIPSISLRNAATDDALAEKLGQSFARWGFAEVADHGIDADLIADADEKMRAFFALPVETKKKYHVPGGGGARGYTPFGIEKAKDADIHDLKEFWHIGRSLPAGHRFELLMAPNIWPEEVPGFRETFEDLFAAFDRTGSAILRCLAEFIGQPSEYFEDTVEDGNSVLRLIHYPPVSGDSGAVRAAPSPRSHCCWAQKKRGWNCSTGTETGCRYRPSRASSRSISAICSSG